MTEIFVLILVSGCLLLILGVSATTLLYVFMCVLELLFLMCTVFFIISLFLVIVSKRTEALCAGITDINVFEKNAEDTGDDNESMENDTDLKQKDKKPVRYALYEIDGVPCRNLYPTDSLSKRMLKVGRYVTVSVAHIGKNKKIIILDTPSLITIITGLPLFTIMSGVLGYLLLAYL
ncbi:MAG: hypothetical protein ACI4E1_09580 [Lachnospira sp.]